MPTRWCLESQPDGTCVCPQSYNGVFCQTLQCKSPGVLNSTLGICQCPAAIGLDATGQCTVSLCGPYGTLTPNNASCICNVNATLIPQITPSNPYYCELACENNGQYLPSILACHCPTNVTGLLCKIAIPFPTPTNSSSSSSSTGHHVISSSSSSTGNGASSSSSTGTSPNNTMEGSELSTQSFTLAFTNVYPHDRNRNWHRVGYASRSTYGFTPRSRRISYSFTNYNIFYKTSNFAPDLEFMDYIF